MATENNAIISVNQTSYDVQEDWLEVASKYFNINTADIYSDNDIQNSNISLLKTGLFGYVNEIMANEVKNAVAHRNVLYDEFFINTASFPESIYRFAKTYNVPISTSKPAHMMVTLAVRKHDLVNSSLREEVVSDQYVDQKVIKTYQLKINRSYEFSVDKFKFSIPYDVIITMRETKNNDYSITARYDIDEDIYSFSSLTSQEIKVFQDINNGEEYVYINLDIYQVKSEISTFTVLSSNITDNLYYTANYTDQLSGFNVYYTYKGERSILRTYFNNTYTPSDTSEKFCYYSFVDDNRLQISFSGMTGMFRPNYNSTIEVEVLSSTGSDGNFTYEGAIDFNFNSVSSDFKSLLVSVIPITSSSGGEDRKSIMEEKQKIIEKKLTRDNLILDSDIDLYFKNINNLNSYNDSSITFMKKRDDILKRIYTAFLLMRDNKGKVLPTNTANNVIFPLNYFNDYNSGDSLNGYIIPEHSLFKYDYNSKKYEFLPNGYDSTIQTILRDDKDNLVYSNPFLIKIDSDPLLNATYYKLDLNESFDMSYTYNNNLIATTLLINKIDIEKSVNFESDLNSDTYTIKLNLNSNESISDVDKKVKIRGVLLSKKDNSKYGYFEFEREILKDNSDRLDSTYTARLSTNRKFQNGLLSLADSLYDENGNVIDNVFINEDIIIKIGVLYNDENREFRTGDSVNSEISIFSDSFPSDIQGTYDINNYVLATSVTTMNTVKLYQNLSNIMSSIVSRYTENKLIEYDNRDFKVEMIPLVSLDYFINQNTYLYTVLNKYIEVLNNIIPKLENNTTIDLKFTNTRGPSNYYYLNTNVVGDDISYLSIERTDILFDFVIHLYDNASDELDSSIKDFISDFLEACNEDGIVPISNLTRLLEQNFASIRFIEFNGLTGRYADVVSNKYQKVIRKDNDFNTMTKQQIIEYVPEYINVKKQLNDNIITVEDVSSPSGTKEISLGKQYNNAINITYIVD